jgi:hypothetical protein
VLSLSSPGPPRYVQTPPSKLLVGWCSAGSRSQWRLKQQGETLARLWLSLCSGKRSLPSRSLLCFAHQYHSGALHTPPLFTLTISLSSYLARGPGGHIEQQERVSLRRVGVHSEEYVVFRHRSTPVTCRPSLDTQRRQQKLIMPSTEQRVLVSTTLLSFQC